MRYWKNGIVFLFCALSLLTVFSMKCEAIIANPQDHYLGEKTYVSPNDLLINDQGIFLIGSEEVCPLTAVFSDSNGLYITQSMIKQQRGYSIYCYNGHSIRCYCGGCIDRRCYYKCNHDEYR